MSTEDAGAIWRFDGPKANTLVFRSAKPIAEVECGPHASAELMLSESEKKVTERGYFIAATRSIIAVEIFFRLYFFSSNSILI